LFFLGHNLSHEIPERRSQLFCVFRVFRGQLLKCIEFYPECLQGKTTGCRETAFGIKLG
jgi:hypothetical protein